ncbi:MAG: phosphoenolpyruvate--protein phosphotransferase [Lachnospiraceae bacterium]|nr:phosphoenolpyruvate--protein phosphotransferase [Lachnospiraceae bacterium]
MERFAGKSMSDGIAIGKIFVYAKDEQVVKCTKVEDVSKESIRYESAKERAIAELHHLYEVACKEVGEENAQIFNVQAMMLEDDDYNKAILNSIQSELVNAEYAVAKTGDSFFAMFAQMEDEYFNARSIDVKDISERIIKCLQGHIAGSQIGDEPVIIVAKELVPSEVVQFDKEKLLGFAMELGSSNSHTAILARMMNVPALIHIKSDPAWNGKLAILDATEGVLIIDPSEKVLAEYRKKYEKKLEQRELLRQLKGKENVTLSGRQIRLYANIGNVKDLASVIQNDAGGIGLFRSEFLYLESDHYPTEEEQLAVYKQVLSVMTGKRVIIRTLDIGADKQVDYFKLDKEENPTMGYRAIRICLDRPDVFKTQLRALYRASVYGTLSIMYPMIISVEEVRKIKEINEEVKKELKEKGIPYRQVEHGIMIETPAAAVISDLLAKEVDFFSIGTNDLTQYTLAIDRQNAKLEAINDSHHEAVLRLIKMTIENAHKEGIWVGICGELGADVTLTERFIEMGIDELSVAPASILSVRKAIRECR